jgi:hypothetical protein
LVLLNGLNGFESILGFGHDFQFGPHLMQPGAKLFAHESLIVGNHSAGVL